VSDRINYHRSQCHIRTCGKTARQHSSTLGDTRPCYAKSSYLLVDPRPFMETSTRSTTCQMDRPTPPRKLQCSHCDSVEASYWSRSLESDATVRADYPPPTTTICVPPLPCKNSEARWRWYTYVVRMSRRASPARRYTLR